MTLLPDRFDVFRSRTVSVIVALCGVFASQAGDLAHLDEVNPYYVSRDFPKLITPQWIGEPGVDAAVILSNDDMRDPAKYEEFLRPILDRLKQVDGRASMSILACSVTPDDPQLQTWIQEGVSIDVHTVAHPCPLLGKGRFDFAKDTYDSCVELMNAIPNNKAVAFRTPCCDSLNTPSPRMFAEIVNKTTSSGQFLAIDSSVFNITTANDAELPREYAMDSDGAERFRKYLPFTSFVNTIEDYPYPYVIGSLCWEFPCTVPSDWEAQNILRPNSPRAVADMKVALDAAVLKQGVYTLVFHPHGWMRSDQVVELIDHATQTHGPRIKFLSFRDVYERLNKNLLAGETLRSVDGGPNGVHLLDLNRDGYQDVVITKSDPSISGAAHAVRRTRVWSPEDMEWIDTDDATPGITCGAQGGACAQAVKYGADESGPTFALLLNGDDRDAWEWRNDKWKRAPRLLEGLHLGGFPILSCEDGRDRGVRLRDLNGDGLCELVVLNDSQRAVFARAKPGTRWKRLSLMIPGDAQFVDAEGLDQGLRLVDFDEDGDLDLMLSNETRYGLFLFESMENGWNTAVLSGTRTEQEQEKENNLDIPPVAKAGANNGGWFHSRHLWVQNETTDTLPDLVDRRSFSDLLANVQPEAKRPDAALKSISVRPGLRVELVAAEPLVEDPVAIAWGADGKLWVVEMRDYPLGMDGKGKPGSRVRFLEDRNGDGRYDKATVFLDGLSYATGVMPWRDGVLVTAAPLIFFARDTNGDGKADQRETLFEGFGEVNQQHRVNGLRWGLDNWVHAANGDGGGKIRCGKTGDVVDIGGRDVRIRPDEGILDPQSGQAQFGIAQDDWGNWFGGANWLPIWHYAIHDEYLRRNPHFAPPAPRVYVVEQAQVYPTSRTTERFNDFEHVNRTTSTCGLEVYRDTLFGSEYYGNAFVCEPVHNLVMRAVMVPDGATFKGHRAPGEDASEFFSSTDNWCRPVMARTGPDGALYIVDMYREVIEHPEYIPKEVQMRLRLRAGDDKGRIYRVVPVHTPLRTVPRLSDAPSSELVRHLESENGSIRDMAHQLLVERQDQSVVPLLEALAGAGTLAQVRLQALCVLDGLGAISEPVIARALVDGHAAVRRHAIRLAEPYLAQWESVARGVLDLATDSDPFVRLQTAYSLGAWNDRRGSDVLAALAKADRSNPHLFSAFVSSVNGYNIGILADAIVDLSIDESAASEVRSQLIQMAVGVSVNSGTRDALRLIAQRLTTKVGNRYEPWQFAVLGEFLEGLTAANVSPETLDVNEQIVQMAELAREVSHNDSADETQRAAALSLLGLDPIQRERDLALLSELLNPKNPETITLAALQAMGKTGDDRVAAMLLNIWPDATPNMRGRMLDVIMSRDPWLDALVDALEQGRVTLCEVDAAHRQKLIGHRRSDIRDRAARLLVDVVNPDRQAVIAQYSAAATTPGQFLRGRHIFRERCASCHRLGSIGHPVGPDLAAITDRSPGGLIESIIDPNRSVETRYFDYSVETNDFQTHNGILAEESANSITLRAANGVSVTLLRNEIESMQSTMRSPMPDGLEEGLSVEDMANLIAFILDYRLKPKHFDGNSPKALTPGADGAFRLTATHAEVYGSTLVFEEKNQNLGFWGSNDDTAVWTVIAPAEGDYEAFLEYACDESNAGNTFALVVGRESRAGTVVSTGSWENYRETPAGVIHLTPGEHRIALSAAGKPDTYLFDLRAVTLRPAKSPRESR